MCLNMLTREPLRVLTLFSKLEKHAKMTSVCLRIQIELISGPFLIFISFVTIEEVAQPPGVLVSPPVNRGGGVSDNHEIPFLF